MAGLESVLLLKEEWNFLWIFTGPKFVKEAERA